MVRVTAPAAEPADDGAPVTAGDGPAAEPAQGERTGDDAITLRRADGVAWLTIDRAQKRNALTLSMWQAIAAACARIEADADIRAVVLTGAGPTFCAGADITALSADDTTLQRAVRAAEASLRTLPMPTIAAIRGFCMGGGTQLAIACDLRLADSTAVFAVPPARLGVIYPPSSTGALAELIGASAAKGLLFTGMRIDAVEALRLRLIDQLLEPDRLEAELAGLVTAICDAAPMTQLAAKAIIDAATPEAAGATYAEWLMRWRNSADAIEGPAAFLQRRTPRFGWRRQSPQVPNGDTSPGPNPADR